MNTTHQHKQPPPTQLCLEYEQKQRCPATTPPVLDVSADGWPGGRHASPTELKMRSGITTISVNFATFPANQSFRTTAESMRPRAKSFIRSISQIEANRQKFSLSMTSEVRKCPKSAKSGRKSGFLLGAVKRGGVGVWNVQMKCAQWLCGSNLLVRNDAQWRHHLHFPQKR